jgi:hypothetical protein
VSPSPKLAAGDEYVRVVKSDSSLTYSFRTPIEYSRVRPQLRRDCLGSQISQHHVSPNCVGRVRYQQSDVRLVSAGNPNSRLKALQRRKSSRHIQRPLQYGHGAWSRISRIYATLRSINVLPLADMFLIQGLSDVWFPFSHRCLPEGLGRQRARNDCIEAPTLVLTKALDLKK